MARAHIGIWLIGAKGGVASTTMVGLTALKKGWIGTEGLVSHLRRFRGLKLAAWSDFTGGGHEIRGVPLAEEAMRLVTESGTISADLLARCRPELEQIDRRIRPGTIYRVGSTIAALADAQGPRREPPRQARER